MSSRIKNDINIDWKYLEEYFFTAFFFHLFFVIFIIGFLMGNINLFFGVFLMGLSAVFVSIAILLSDRFYRI